MHAYDLKKLRRRDPGATGRARVSRSRFLDGKAINAPADVLLITDGEGAVGPCGHHGGLAHRGERGDHGPCSWNPPYFSPDGDPRAARARLGLARPMPASALSGGVDPSQQGPRHRARDRIAEARWPEAPPAPSRVTPIRGRTCRGVPPWRLRAKQLTRLLGAELPAGAHRGDACGPCRCR